MSADTAGIVCAKCGAPGSVDTMTCAKCGGRVVHVCPNCKFHNAAAKNFCDVCGEALRGARKSIPMPEPRPEQVQREPEPPPRREEKPSRREEPPPREAKLPPLEKLPPLGKPPEEKPPAEEKPVKLELRAPERAAPPPPREEPFAELPRTVMRRLDDEEAPPPDSEPPKRRDPHPEPRLPLPEVRAPLPKRSDTIHLKPPTGDKRAEDERADALRKRLEKERAELQKLVKKEPPPQARADRPREHRREEPRREEPRRELRREPAPQTHYGAETLRRIQSKPVFSTLLGLFLLVTGTVLFIHTQRTRNTPAKTILKTAGDYLFALKQKDYAAAYAMLSSASKRSVSPNRFEEMQDSSVWTFDDVQIDWVTDKAAFVRFKLLVSAQPMEEDGILFVREGGQWRRSYWWHLADDIESAVEAADYTRALRLTNDALSLDPYDPMTNAYVCEISFRLGNQATAEPACQKALKASEKLPSRLGPEGIFQIHLMLADMYRRQFRKPADAEREFAVALAFPGLSPADRCDILNARGDMRYELAAYPQALEDFRAAQGSCQDPVDQGYAERSIRILSGAAGAEAVAAAQAYRMPGDENTLLEWRQNAQKDLNRRLNIKNPKPGAGEKEVWTPRYEAGAVYSVSVRDDVAELLTAKVDLWTYQVKVDIHAQ